MTEVTAPEIDVGELMAQIRESVTGPHRAGPHRAGSAPPAGVPVCAAPADALFRPPEPPPEAQ